jgi:hypothetical protein
MHAVVDDVRTFSPLIIGKFKQALYSETDQLVSMKEAEEELLNLTELLKVVLDLKNQ